MQTPHPVFEQGSCLHSRASAPRHAVVSKQFRGAQLQHHSNVAHAPAILPFMRAHNLPLPLTCTAGQGTAATALAGLVGALRVLGKPAKDLSQQRVLCVGAGSAGMGVVRMIAAGESQGAPS